MFNATVVSSVCILLVDDHVGVRTRIRELLSSALDDARFFEAGTAALGIRLGLENGWDIAIIDIQLPDRSGLDVIRQLAIARPGFPIIAVSVMDLDVFVSAAKAAGAGMCIGKQDLAAELLAALREMGIQ